MQYVNNIDNYKINNYFYKIGKTNLNNKGDFFIDFFSSLPKILTFANEYITNLLLNNKNEYYEPFYFTISSFESIIESINNNNYTIYSSTKEDLITTIYTIKDHEKIIFFVTFFNINKNLLYFEIPNNLTNNSFEKASFYIDIKENSLNYHLSIPNAFFVLCWHLFKVYMHFTFTNFNLENYKRKKLKSFFFEARTEGECALLSSNDNCDLRKLWENYCVCEKSKES